MTNTTNRTWPGWVIGLAIFLLILVGTIASAGPSHAAPRPAGVVYTLDASGFHGNAGEVARDWSKNTGITVVQANCSGPRCVHLRSVSEITPCGSTVGCSWGADDGSCNAAVQYYADGYGLGVTTAVGKHEFGHCAGLWHLANVLCVMHSPMDPYNYPRRLCAEERSISRSLR